MTLTPRLRVVVVALVALTGACTDDSGQEAKKAKPPCGSFVDDGELFMQIGATDEQIAAVRDALRQSEDVASFCYLSKQDALREFRRLFADKPKLLEDVRAGDLPVSFRVRLVAASAEDAFEREFATLSGVDQVLFASDRYMVPTSPAPNGPVCGIHARIDVPTEKEVRYDLVEPLDAEVFMLLNADQAQIDGVRSALNASRTVVSFGFLTQNDAYEEFKELFADDPDVIAMTSPDDLPVSFRTTLLNEEACDTFRTEFGALPGVEIVVLTGVTVPPD